MATAQRQGNEGPGGHSKGTGREIKKEEAGREIRKDIEWEKWGKERVWKRNRDEGKARGDNECVEVKTVGMSTGEVCVALLQPYNILNFLPVSLWLLASVLQLMQQVLQTKPQNRSFLIDFNDYPSKKKFWTLFVQNACDYIMVVHLRFGCLGQQYWFNLFLNPKNIY